MERDEDIIPEPTSPSKIAVPKGGFVNLIEIWMPSIRDEMANRAYFNCQHKSILIA